MKKAQNKTKTKIKSLRKTLATCITVTLLVLLYWIWIFHVTQPATDKNTYKINEKVAFVELKLNYHRSENKLYIITDKNHKYLLVTGHGNNDKAKDLKNQILSSKEQLTFTVWEHFPQYSSIMYNERPFLVKEVVDLRSDDTEYWNMQRHNKNQKIERICGILGGILLLIVPAFFWWMLYTGKDTRRQGTVSVKPNRIKRRKRAH